ncbi:MAG TPA: anti-sigma factor [Fimbriimonadaceae bacterium]|nr:anti-sigma factor [Fimbriimonadaceae bacterium]
MICDEARILLSAYQDGELPPERREAIEQHLKACPACAATLGRSLRLGDAIRAHAPSYRAPESLWNALSPATSPRFWRPFAAGLAIGLAGVLAVFLLLGRPAPRDFTADLVSDHVRSLMASHLIDVQSTDRHTVKPWFLGKLDFSPAVPDLSADGFPLVGGRLDYVGRHPAAALVYRRAKHVINVFVLPARADFVGGHDLDGYHVRRWRIGDLDYWAVSDVEPAQLQEFATRFQSAG